MKKLHDEPLKKHTTFRIGGPAENFIVPENIEELRGVILKSNGKFIVLGMGSNMIFPDKKIKAAIINTSKINHCIVDGTSVTAGAGLPLSKLLKITAEKGLSGLEFLAGIPGTVGGAVKGNAGAWRQSIGQIVEFVKVFTNKGVSRKCPFSFSYRKSNIKGVIYEVGLKLKKKKPSLVKKSIKKYLAERRKRQPSGPSAGSVFINPVAAGENKYTAGQLIEMAGLKGLRIGEAMVSKKHANFIVNMGKATSSDVKKLIKKIQKTVKKKFGIVLEAEIRVL